MERINKKIKSNIIIWALVMALATVGNFSYCNYIVKADMTVYITRTGSKYHTHKCGNGYYYPSDLTTAKEMGLEPCSKCFPYGEPNVSRENSSVSGETKKAKPIKINKRKMVLIKGKSARLKIKNATQPIKWKSTKKSVAVVSSKGKVTAKKAGMAIIIASVGNQKKRCKIRVESPKLSFNKIAMTVGENKVLKLKGCRHSVKWSSDDSDIVSVKKGKLTAKDVGTAKISARVHGKKYTCKIVVKKPDVMSVSLETSNITLNLYEEVSLQYTSNPKTVPDYYDATWTSQNSSVVYVKDQYYDYADIYAAGIGETDIILTVGGKTTKCHVVVQ